MNSIIQDAVMNSEVFDDLYMSEEEEDKLQDQSDIWLPDKIRKARSRNAHFTLQDRQNSIFWKKYVKPGLNKDDPIHDEYSREGRKFRSRFRVPYKVFLEIVDDVKKTNGLPNFKVLLNGKEGVHIYLLILGSLRALASGCTFDAIEELTCVSQEAHRVFFQDEFCMWGMRVGPDHIKMPDDTESLRHIMALYERLGLPGCAGSVDCVHVIWDKCPASEQAQCKGKDKVTTLAFQVVGSHTKRILSVSQWFGGTWNDKSISRCDKVFDLFRKNEGSFLATVKWSVFMDRSCSDKLRFLGAYLICDGGYHDWPCLVCPYKHQIPGTSIESWSKNVESVRKDIECIFGILKKRFLFLKHPIRLHCPDKIHRAFVTCCVLHNILLDYDGYENWNYTEADISVEYNILEDLAELRASKSLNRQGGAGVRSSRKEQYGAVVDVEPAGDTALIAEEKQEFDTRRAALIKHYDALHNNRALRLEYR